MSAGAPGTTQRTVQAGLPLRRRLTGCGGFTYTAMIVTVVIVGIMLGVTGQLWSTMMKREREEELIFRGLMIRNAIERWYNPLPGQHAASSLTELKHLMEDPRALQKTRYLPRLYEDPLTGKEWKPITGDVKGVSGIVGVASSSEEAPFKTAGFPEELKELEGKQKYSEWKFVYQEGTSGAAVSGTVNLGGTGGTGGSGTGGTGTGGTGTGGSGTGGTGTDGTGTGGSGTSGQKWDPINAEFR
jgi:type II secretory pathway pseudopilin PulG